jgi:uncharacterized protein with FMN-binding domain
MHRFIPALMSTAAIALPTANAWAAATTAPQTAAKTKVVTRKVVGSSAQADRWGYVQVTLVVRKTTTTVGKKTTVKRKVTGVSATYPNHTDRSVFINQHALPYLYHEVLAAQLNPNIQLVSGATDSSYAFVQSLQSAILLAKKV